MPIRLFCLLLIILPLSAQVKVWEDTLTVPTYVVGPPETNPIFYTGRTYQGARGRSTRTRCTTSSRTAKEDKSLQGSSTWRTSTSKIGILPELGGRIFEAVDKTNGYDFFYRQHVIKPALIGMIGRLDLGRRRVEHPAPPPRLDASCRSTTALEENADGSKTDLGGRARTAAPHAVGRRAHAASRALVRWRRRSACCNRTPLAHSMLYFANVAVHANDDYQVIFPPRTQFVTQHAKTRVHRAGPSRTASTAASTSPRAWT